MTMKRVLVGGPLLGRDGRFQQNNTFEPIVAVVRAQQHRDGESATSSASARAKNKKDERRSTSPSSSSSYHHLVLLPTSRYVTVLSYKTGKRIATLLPGTEDEEKHTGCVIESVALVASGPSTRPRRKAKAGGNDGNDDDDGTTTVLLAGLRDGTVREFALDVLADAAELLALQQSKRLVSNECGGSSSSRFRVPGPCLRPRRVLRVAGKDQPVLHLAAVSRDNHNNQYSSGISNNNKDGGDDDDDSVIVYAIVAEKERPDKKTKKSGPVLNASLVRVAVVSPGAKSPKNKRKTDLRNEVVVMDKKLKYSSSGKRKDEDARMYPPFRLVASRSSPTSRSVSDNKATFVMIASPSSLCVYYDIEISAAAAASNKGKEKKQQEYSPCVTFPAPSSTNMLSAFSVASNGKDVALGHVDGGIRIMDNLLSAVEDYHVAMAHYKAASATGKTSGIHKPKHPAENVVARKIHWHAHPVATLAYDSGSNDTMLYSGGEESVLVTWQLTRGSYKPAEVLPRVALGGIVHVLCVEQHASAAGGILVYSDDNSLQLFESHNKSRVWKVQGSAAQQRTEILPSQSSVRLDHCPGSSSSNLIFAGLPRAPGYIHCYDPISQQVVSSLEVAPFNRISRTRRKDSPMPTPSITHAGWSGNNGDVLVTVDVAATENASVGSFQELSKKGGGVGIVSTIRFWDRIEQQGPNKYELTAAMAYPHGTAHRVSALCLSSDGRHACTVSNDENAFRLWRREESKDDDCAANQRNTASWSCQYRVSTPAGFAKFPVGKDAVAFSPDSSILAIAYGNLITLWDYHEMTLLTSVHHVEDDDSAIAMLEFLSTEQVTDMILSVSSKGVALQSSYGAFGPANEGWSFRLPYDTETSHICCAIYLPTSDAIAIAVYNHKINQSSITFVDATTGKRYKQGSTDNGVVDGIPNKIVSISASSYDKSYSSNWGEQVHEKNNRPLRLYVLTNAGDVIYLDSHLEEDFVPEKEDVALATSIPHIPLLEEVQRRSLQQKRPLIAVTVDEIGVPLKKRMLVDNYFGGKAGVNVASAPELPRLSKAFTRSFVGRHLQRQ